MKLANFKENSPLRLRFIPFLSDHKQKNTSEEENDGSAFESGKGYEILHKIRIIHKFHMKSGTRKTWSQTLLLGLGFQPSPQPTDFSPFTHSGLLLSPSREQHTINDDGSSAFSLFQASEKQHLNGKPQINQEAVPKNPRYDILFKTENRNSNSQQKGLSSIWRKKYPFPVRMHF